MNTKVAIPSRGELVDDHFGHCEYFTIITIENDFVVSKEKLEAAKGCGCKSNIVNELSKLGVSVMLAGNMGQGAVNKLSQYNIEVLRGCNGTIDSVVEKYIKGEIKDSFIVCSSHSHSHDCGNH